MASDDDRPGRTLQACLRSATGVDDVGTVRQRVAGAEMVVRSDKNVTHRRRERAMNLASRCKADARPATASRAGRRRRPCPCFSQKDAADGGRFRGSCAARGADSSSRRHPTHRRECPGSSVAASPKPQSRFTQELRFSLIAVWISAVPGMKPAVFEEWAERIVERIAICHARKVWLTGEEAWIRGGPPQ